MLTPHTHAQLIFFPATVTELLSQADVCEKFLFLFLPGGEQCLVRVLRSYKVQHPAEFCTHAIRNRFEELGVAMAGVARRAELVGGVHYREGRRRELGLAPRL